ncbi:hypothetical protein [Methylocystis bryophila]|uniref:Uncharacterized protein n=1 Tax=Methylocystis bryophila TaxID=655015 RepID=A0A1W6MQ85_9HYPH|nr:hypothetical protein [Methylocystis bryophila]ARN79735.1 hypothetical protein B1812_00135 [Methylocystis bryophila]BDV39610.1 hypothetical protein DSM21852_28630 [Methylocystis bryophila]
MSDDLTSKPGVDIERSKQERIDLLVRLREVTRQRDELLSQYESMAFQVDESTKDVDGALLEARANAKRAEACEVLERQESAQIAELTRQLDEERRKSGEVASDFARYRSSMEQKLAEHAQREDPWILLAFAISQILSQSVAWVRAKIPADSPFLPWFDRLVEFAKTAGQLAFEGGKAFFEWAKPHVIELWKRLKSEIAQRTSKG